MNERIRLLAEQAEILITEVGAFHNTPQGAYQLKEQHMKKFAELIVQECANAIVNDSRLSDVRTARNGCVRAIKQHFGVEE